MSINKKKLRKTLNIYIAVMLVLIFASKSIYNFSLPRVTVAMPASGRLAKEFEARGVIAFSESYDIYAVLNGQIDGIFIKKGDVIGENTVIATCRIDTSDNEVAIAELGSAIARIENQLAIQNLSKSNIQDKMNALDDKDYAGELYGYQCAVDDAMMLLKKRQTELDEARKLAGKPFDGHKYEQAIADAERERNRRRVELDEAETAYIAAETNDGGIFDDYIFQQNMEDAKINLSRRKTELKEAENALADAKKTSPPIFDGYNYQNDVNSAKINYNRMLDDYNDALRQYDLILHYYDDLIFKGANDDEIAIALKNIENAWYNIIASKRTLDDADAMLDKAINDMKRAENAYYTASGNELQQSIADIEKTVKSAKNAVDDAQRIYYKAVDDYDRASLIFYKNDDIDMQNAIDAAKINLSAAQSAADDSEIEFNRAVDAYNRAAANARLDAQKNISIAETNLADAQTALVRAENNYELAYESLASQADDIKKSLEMEMKNANLNIERTNIDLRVAETSLNGINDIHKEKTDITSDYQGVVLSVEKKKGQFVSKGEKIAVIGVNNTMFICNIVCPKSDGKFIEIGDEASIRVSGVSSALKAVVCEILPEDDLMNIRLTCETDQHIGGKYVTINFDKKTDVYYKVVPNEAIRRESSGSYVWVVRSKQGVLGTEYYSIKVKVLISDSDDYYTAISKGLEYIEPVIINSDRDLIVNGRVNKF